jgi:hypothetical protein
MGAACAERGDGAARATCSIPRFTGGTVTNSWQQSGPLRDGALRKDYERVYQLLVARGVKFPADDPDTVRRRVFGPNNPIDVDRRQRKAAARSAREAEGKSTR